MLSFASGAFFLSSSTRSLICPCPFLVYHLGFLQKDAVAFESMGGLDMAGLFSYMKKPGPIFVFYFGN